MNDSQAISLRGYANLLREYPNFRRLWLGQIVSGTGDWFYSVAIYDLLFRLTGSAKPVAIAVGHGPPVVEGASEALAAALAHPVRELPRALVRSIRVASRAERSA